MTAPSFLNTGFAFTALPVTTVDVQDIINAIATMLTTTLSATPTAVYPSGERWTSLGGGAYKSPVDSAGRFCTITISRTTITRMQFRIDDPAGLLQDGEIDIAAGGSVVNIYGGPGHILVEANNAGTWETAAAILSDPTPEPLGTPNVYVWCRTSRTSAGGLQGNNASADWWMGRRWDGVNTTGSGFLQWLARCVMPAQDNSNTHLRTQAGSEVAAPAEMSVNKSGLPNSFLNAGKLYQCVIVDSNQVPGVDLNIPIDTGVTGQFRVLHLGPIGCAQFGIRKG